MKRSCRFALPTRRANPVGTSCLKVEEHGRPGGQGRAVQRVRRIGKAIANGRRAALLDVLAQSERHVDDLATEIGQSVANTSFHLRALASEGLVTTRRDGTRVYYHLASEAVANLWGAVQEVAPLTTPSWISSPPPTSETGADSR